MNARRWAAPVVLGCVLASAGAAAAQSRRYPAPPVDKDQQADETSQLWEQAVEPQRAPQTRLLHEAKRLILGRTPADLQGAVSKATAAIELRPGEPSAYFLRALAHEQLGRWRSCADDFAEALKLDPKLVGDPELRYAENPLLGAGICLARAGRLAEAERMLDNAVARSPGTLEWLRLAETRIAMGKLREGQEALVASTDASGESSPSLLNLWLRALAFDRARQTAEAAEAIAAASVGDRFLRQLTNPAVPFLSQAEELYLLGLGWEGISRPELALAYFRAALATKGSEIWARRIQEHIDVLEATAFPTEVSRSGPAKLDAETARAAVRKAMPQLAACVAATPMVAFTVRLARSRPAPAGSGPHAGPPAPGVSVSTDVALGEPSAETLAAAEACIKEISLRLDLPPIKEANTWHYITFSVVAHRAASARPAPGPRR